MKQDYFILDAHCDTISKAYDEGADLSKNELHNDLERQRAYGGFLQAYAIWIDDFFAVNMPLKKTLILIDRYYNELEKNMVAPVRTKAELLDVIQNKKLGGLLAIEGGEAIEGDLSVLRNLYRLGVRILTLTWNRRNAIADGVELQESKNGLSRFGREVVKEMNRLGMVIDVSHSNEYTIQDVLELSEKPIIASHSNARALCSFWRNLTDRQFEALIQNGGVAGINLCDEFLTDGGKNCSVDSIFAHIEHFLALGGEKNVGLGADLDGVDVLPQGFAGTQDYDQIIEGMLKRNYSEEVVRGILYANFERVLLANFVE